MQTLLLLHGAIGSSAQLERLKEVLSNHCKVYILDLPGHGGRELPKKFSIDFFAESVVEFLNENSLKKVSILGYSMGGYVAMYLAKHYPSLIDKVITLATKFHWDEEASAKEVKMLQPDVIEQKIPAFARTLEQRHSPANWKQVLNYTADMLRELGRNNTLKLEDYSSIETQSLIMIGDRDKMVSLDETVAVYKQLPKAQLAVLPNTPHPIEQVNIELPAFNIQQFLGV